MVGICAVGHGEAHLALRGMCTIGDAQHGVRGMHTPEAGGCTPWAGAGAHHGDAQHGECTLWGLGGMHTTGINAVGLGVPTVG